MERLSARFQSIPAAARQSETAPSILPYNAGAWQNKPGAKLEVGALDCTYSPTFIVDHPEPSGVAGRRGLLRPRQGTVTFDSSRHFVEGVAVIQERLRI